MNTRKSWMPLWVALVCASIAFSAFYVVDIWLVAIMCMQIFWLLSYIRYNQLAHIKRLPMLAYFAWSFPAITVIHRAIRFEPTYQAIFMGCMVIFILAGLIEAIRIAIYDRGRPKDTQPTREARQAARQAARKQAEQDAANPAYVRKSERAEGFFEVVGGTKPNGKPHQIYYTPDHDKAERIAAERRNKGGL